MTNISIGTTHEEVHLVTGEVAISFLGPEGARVLATPYMIRFMEWTCRNCVFPLLEPGHDTVGTHVDWRHLRATPIGMAVTYRAEVVEATEKKVKFKVDAFDEKEKCGEGFHERGIINVAKFTARMAAKAEG